MKKRYLTSVCTVGLLMGPLAALAGSTQKTYHIECSPSSGMLFGKLHVTTSMTSEQADKLCEVIRTNSYIDNTVNASGNDSQLQNLVTIDKVYALNEAQSNSTKLCNFIVLKRFSLSITAKEIGLDKKVGDVVEGLTFKDTNVASKDVENCKCNNADFIIYQIGNSDSSDS